MNTEDRQAAERRLAAWLNETAPMPPTEFRDRVLARTATVQQRSSGRIMDMFGMRALAVVGVIAAAVVVGLNLTRVIGPEPPVGASAPASSSDNPTARQVASGEATSSLAPAEPGRIAFQADRENETSGIYVMDSDGSNVVQLIDDPAVHEMSPIWSPDGSHVAYITTSADGNMLGGVFIIDGAGGEPIQVDDKYAYAPATWSPDGSMLAVGGDGSEGGIGVYHVAEGRFDSLTDDGGTAPLWSPDGSRIAYNVAPPNDIRVVEVATGETRNLTDDAWNDSVARWSEDGTQLIFVSDRNTDQARDSSRSWMVSADGGDPELVGDDPVLAFAHWPSPDGEWLAYIHPDGSGLHLSRADGSQDRIVHATTPADMGASWAADSSGFVFSNAGEAPRDIYAMRVDADAPDQLTADPADESAPSWGPPGA